MNIGLNYQQSQYVITTSTSNYSESRENCFDGRRCILSGWLQQIMREEYSKLGKSLFAFYMTRLLTLVLIFYAAFAYVNDFYTHYYDNFNDSSAALPFDELANVLSLASDAAKSMYQTSQVILADNSSAGVGNYCTSSQSFSDCQAFLFNSLENQLIYSAYGIYTSFQCLQGDCAELSLLWDYFWTFRIRLTFISYIIVEYNSSGGSEKLIVPACSNETVSFDFSNNDTQWVLVQKQGVIALSYSQNDAQNALRVTIVMNGERLMQEYSLSLMKFDIPPQSLPNSPYLTFSLQNTSLFGFSPAAAPFTVPTWFFNFLIFLACVCCVGPMLRLSARVIDGWEQGLFRQMQSLDNLYQYQINSIFEGGKPKKSVVLNDSSFTHFYEDLAEVVDKDCEPLLNVPPVPEKEETFKFTALIDRVMAKFEESLKPLEEERGREFSNLKPLIRSSIAEISESVQRKLRDLFLKARELGMATQFFHFGYLAVLESTPAYEELLALQRTALPDALVALFRYMNHTINSGDLKFAFKFAFAYNHIIEQQIIMRLQDQLLPKYLDALKNLDVMEPTFRHRLRLGKRLADLELNIENKRHISAVYLK